MNLFNNLPDEATLRRPETQQVEQRIKHLFFFSVFYILKMPYFSYLAEAFLKGVFPHLFNSLAPRVTKPGGEFTEERRNQCHSRSITFIMG
jgi:hypothetical protein